MTAHAMAEERQKCIDAGMQDHIAKPIDPDALYRTLAAWCKPKGTSQAVARAAPATQAEAIPVVEGLDTAAGLRRVGGNGKLYLKLLRQFVAGQSQTVASIRASLKAGDRKTAERIAHTAKGVSGNIGADAVQRAAGRLEQAIEAGNENARMIAALDRSLRKVLAQLEAALVESPPQRTGPAAHAVDAQKLKEVLARLAALLRVSDGEAIRLLSSEEALLRPALGPDFVALERAVNDFDFDSALERLQSSADQHNVAL
jgi:HPt (histidine-containing phosphotransfer) domain-containing protein